jgi:hypothetical protein
MSQLHPLVLASRGSQPLFSSLEFIVDVPLTDGRNQKHPKERGTAGRDISRFKRGLEFASVPAVLG